MASQSAACLAQHGPFWRNLRRLALLHAALSSIDRGDGLLVQPTMQLSLPTTNRAPAHMLNSLKLSSRLPLRSLSPRLLINTRKGFDTRTFASASPMTRPEPASEAAAEPKAGLHTLETLPFDTNFTRE